MRTGFLHWLRKISATPGRALTPLSFTRHQVYIHPCVIDNRPHIVYPRGLALRAPKLFRALENHYRRQGFALKEDRRSAKPAGQVAHERRRWAPILLFTADLIFEGAAFADTAIGIPDTEASADRQVVLQLAARDANRYPPDALRTSPSQRSATVAPDAAAAGRIYDLFMRRYERRDADPVYISGDFREIANYYSAFPAIVGMLDDLENKNWRLVYDESNWMTVANGNVFQVDRASVHFNTRSAAQLKMYNQCKDNPVCIASPADVLLHELLHAHSMLVHTRKFIAQGGMSSVMYPYKHEYAIIECRAQALR